VDAVSSETHQLWDREAAAFDDQPDHGLRDPVVRQAWALRHRTEAQVQHLDDPALWGGPVSDERYLLTSRR
jgi:hypothetical protein